MSTHVRVAYGGSDVSNGSNANPYTVNNLNGTKSDIGTAEVLNIYTEPGLKTSGLITVRCVGTNYDKWRLSWDGTTWSNWGVQIVTNDVITSTGKALHIQARAVPSDSKGRDDTVDLNITATVLSV